MTFQPSYWFQMKSHRLGYKKLRGPTEFTISYLVQIKFHEQLYGPKFGGWFIKTYFLCTRIPVQGVKDLLSNNDSNSRDFIFNVCC
jgi:hypothetical protein